MTYFVVAVVSFGCGVLAATVAFVIWASYQKHYTP